MAYYVYLDETKIHDLSLPAEYCCFCDDMTLDLSTDLKIDAFTFTMVPTHPQYNDVHVINSIVKVTDDDETLFIGRVITVEQDFNRKKTISCEEVMAFLSDVAAEPFCEQNKNISNHPVVSHYDTPKGWMDYFLNNAGYMAYNKLCDANKTIELGTFSSSRKCTIQTEDPVSIFEMLKTIHDECEGYTYIRYGDDGKYYLDYVQDFDEKCTQTIEFGKNILDITTKLDGSNLYTILYAVGAPRDDVFIDSNGNQLKYHEGWNDRLHASFENGGTRFAKNQTLINLYGKIYGVKVYDGCDDGNTLNELAQAAVNSQALNMSITVTAADLSLVNANIEKFRIRTYARVKSLPHDVDVWMLIKNMHIDMSNPQNTTVTLGVTRRTLSEKTVGWKEDR